MMWQFRDFSGIGRRGSVQLHAAAFDGYRGKPFLSQFFENFRGFITDDGGALFHRTDQAAKER